MKIITQLFSMLAVLASAIYAGGLSAYDQIYIFGDSLSDSGAYAGNADADAGGKFTTNPGPVWVENLGQQIGVTVTANNPNNPNTSASGNNFAQGGAQINNPIGIGQSPSPQAAQPISTQVATFLGMSPQANPNALYTVWGGANDVFFNAGLLGSGSITQDQAGQNMRVSAGTLVALINQLGAAGARTIIVPNLPDIGNTPATILQAIQTAGAGNPNLATALGAATLALRTPANSAADQQAVQNAAIAQAETILGFPAGSLASAVAQTGAAFSGLSSAFNTFLNISLQSGTANVIPLDVNSLLNEAIADPASFGLSNVTGPACNTPSSLNCTSPFFASAAAPQTFLFADSVHPTTAAHALISSYAAALLQAPALISSLADTPISAGRQLRNNVRSQLRLMANQPVGTFAPFVSGGYRNQSADRTAESQGYDVDAASLFGSLAYRVMQHVTVGLALNQQFGDVEWDNNLGGFDQDGTYVSLFAGYDHDRFFANTVIALGELSYDSIQRNIAFGSATQSRAGDTEGNHQFISLTGGASLLQRGNLAIGPIIGLTYHNVEVDGYRETGSSATAMRFAGQERDSFLIEGGLFANLGVNDKLNLRGSVLREEELKDDPRSLQIGINNASSLLSVPAQKPEGGAWVAEVGASMAISRDISATANYYYRNGDDYETDHMINLGLQVNLP